MLIPQSPKALRAILPAALVLPILFLTACKSDYPASGKAATGDPKSQPRQVKTVKVAEVPIGETVVVNGNLAAYDHTTVGMKVPGLERPRTVEELAPGYERVHADSVARISHRGIAGRENHDRIVRQALLRDVDGRDAVRSGTISVEQN